MAASLSCAAWACAGAAAAQSAGQKPPTETLGNERVNPDAKAIASLMERVKEYITLHEKLVGTLPKLSKDSTPQEIDKHQRALGRLIRQARASAKQGDIFSPESRAVIRRLLIRVFSGPEGRQRIASIMDENPGPLKLAVNGRYPDSVPLSTMPPQVLEGLPNLPDQLQFRFVGRRLILLDEAAHIIADYIENALPAK